MVRRRRSRQRIRIGIRLGSIIRDGRERLALTKSALAERAGVSRQMLAAIEGGTANPTLDRVVQILDGLGLDLDVRAAGPILVGGPRSHDAAHSICLDYVQRRLEAAGWMTAREVRIEDGRYVGWIDLLAFHAPTGALLVIEVKTRIDDLGAIERSMDWYERAASAAARRMGWRPRRTAGWLVALSTDEVERRIGDDRASFDRLFPDRALAMTAVVSDPGRLGASRGLALIDPRSRRRSWLIRTRTDGRRSASAYGGYADFMASVRPSVGRRHSK